METNGQVCPICGAKTVEDLPTEMSAGITDTAMVNELRTIR